MSEHNSNPDQPDDKDGEWEETDLWEGIQDAKDESIIRPRYAFEF